MIVGIDLKLTGDGKKNGTGLTIMNFYGKSKTLLLEGPSGDLQMCERQRIIAENVTARVLRDSIVVIEDYAYAAKSSSDTKLKELGGIVKFAIWRKTGLYPITLAPKQLQKWATGKGSGKKNVVLKWVFKRFDKDFECDDEADSYVCADFGLHLIGMGRDVLTKYEEEVIKAVTSGLHADQRKLLKKYLDKKTM